ncbi:hypothetical protein HZS_3305, partial [Henneguya salminicola]
LSKMNDLKEKTDHISFKKESFFILILNQVKMMMYGFGDEIPHYSQSVKILDIIAQDYIKDMTAAASKLNKKEKVNVEDLLYLVRNDPRKHKRAK